MSGTTTVIKTLSPRRSHRRPARVIRFASWTRLSGRLENAAAKHADRAGRVLAGEFHLAEHVFLQCRVLNLLARQRHPDRAPIMAACLQGHPWVRNLERIEERAVLDH